MPMDSQHYVAQQADGSWIVVYGNDVSYYNTQGEAENVYNSMAGPGGGGGGGGGFPIVGGMDQTNSLNWQQQQEYLRLQLAENKRQFDTEQAEKKRQFDLLQASTLDKEKLAENKRQFDASQAEDIRQFDASQAQQADQFKQSQGQQNQQYWAGLLGSLSGPRDWMKYQIAQSQMPESVRGGPMNVMDIANATPAFGAVQGDPSNSWEQTWANFQNAQQGAQQPYQQQQGYNPVEPPGGAQPGTPGGDDLYSALLRSREPYQQPRTDEMPNTSPAPWYGGKQPPGQDATQPGGFDPRRRGYNPVEPPGGKYLGATIPLKYREGYNPVEPPGGGRPPGGYLPAPPEEPWLGGGRQQPGKEPYRTPWYGGNQPIQISPGEYGRWTPTQRAMQEGEWSKQSLDPSDMWAKMRSAWPKGYAQTKTQWR